MHDVLYAIIFNYSGRIISTIDIFIGPESDHWQCLSLTDSLTNSLTHSRLVNLIDVTLACEDANSNLVEVVTLAYVSDEDRVGNSSIIGNACHSLTHSLTP